MMKLFILFNNLLIIIFFLWQALFFCPWAAPLGGGSTVGEQWVSIFREATELMSPYLTTELSKGREPWHIAKEGSGEAIKLE